MGPRKRWSSAYGHYTQVARAAEMWDTGKEVVGGSIHFGQYGAGRIRMIGNWPRAHCA